MREIVVAAAQLPSDGTAAVETAGTVEVIGYVAPAIRDRVRWNPW